MKFGFLIFLFVCSSYFAPDIKGQKNDIKILFHQFEDFYNSGDLVMAEKTLFKILDYKDFMPESYISAIYTNLGVINLFLGRYVTALDYINNAENLIKDHAKNYNELAVIYINKASIYNIQKSYDLAISYLEKSIRLYEALDNQDNSIFQSLSSAYLNIGIAYYETGDFNTALKFFHKSEDLKIKYNLYGLELVYLNVAKTFNKTGDLVKAEEFYLKSISRSIKQYGEDYFRLAEVFFDYGLFLRSAGRNNESIETLQKALSICLKNYGEKHTLVSMSFKLIGDHYNKLNDYNQALIYYQKALIAVVNDFNNPDYLSNPSIDSTLFDIRLLDNLKSKAQALEMLALQNDHADGQLLLNKSLETMELALTIIDRIRNNYPSEDNKIYLAENEKESYIYATHLAYSLSFLPDQKTSVKRMYNIAQKAKSAILRNEISGNELLMSAGIPDSLLKKQKNLASNIASYNYLITKEMSESEPDDTKILLFKDALFNMNRESEKIIREINLIFPQYNDLLQKADPVSLSELQQNLRRNETIIEYLLSNRYEDGNRKLYIFIISRDNLKCLETNLDTSFFKNAEIIRKFNNREVNILSQNTNFIKYTESLYFMYENLIKPGESHFSGKNLIIIPDEEIAWLPFDAFIKSRPPDGQISYEGLDFLIHDYIFSYGYTSSLIFSKEKIRKNVNEVYSFSPGYENARSSSNQLNPLRGAGKEIEFIYRLFDGKSFTGEQATEAQFLESTSQPAIFHLAMHALSDSSDSRYSYFAFDTVRDSVADGKLHNYEISLTRLKSPMVVMSACNTGSGTLYQGEGLMSLARGFILAGASSVVKTIWDVNDEASETIISGFYYNLSKGMYKDEALRKAKLEFINNSPPSLKNPYYWAAYEVMGDNAPINKNFRTVMKVAGIIVIIMICLLIIYLRRRNIFSDLSL